MGEYVQGVSFAQADRRDRCELFLLHFSLDSRLNCEADYLFCLQVPLSQIPDPVYKTSVDWINHLPLMTLCGFVLWAFNHILTYLAAAQLGHTKGGEKAAQHTSSKSRVILENLSQCQKSHLF